MHAVFVEVEMKEPTTEAAMADARERLSQMAVPQAREAGALAGYWFGSLGASEGHAVMVFEDEARARKMVEQMPKVGEDAAEGVTFRRIEVREVLTSL